MPHEIKPVSRLYKYTKLLTSEKSIYWFYGSVGPVMNTDFNHGCFNVSKSRINKLNEEIFKRKLEINPLTCKKSFIEKPEGQCVGFPVIHNNPISPKKGFTYQKKLNWKLEIRYFYCKAGGDFYIKKYRSVFQKKCDYGTIHSGSIFLLQKFAEKIGMDFGEMEAMYDDDGNLFVIDVNNMPGNGDLFKRTDNPDFAENLFKKQAIILNSM